MDQEIAKLSSTLADATETTVLFNTIISCQLNFVKEVKRARGNAKREKAKAKEKEKEREKAKVKESQKEKAKGKVKGKEKERKEKVKSLELAISATKQVTLRKIATLRRATGDKTNKVHKTTNLDNGQNQKHPEQDAPLQERRTDLCVTTSSLGAVAKEVTVLFGTRVYATPSRKEHVM